jgi:hypothetical protein
MEVGYNPTRSRDATDGTPKAHQLQDSLTWSFGDWLAGFRVCFVTDQNLFDKGEVYSAADVAPLVPRKPAAPPVQIPSLEAEYQHIAEEVPHQP